MPGNARTIPPTDPAHLPPPQEHRGERVRLLLNPDCAPAVQVDDLVRLPAIVARLQGSTTRQPGRPTCWVWRPAWHEGPGLLVRQYAHGGVLGRLWGTLFVGAARMRQELAVSRYAVAAGVAAPLPVAVRVEGVFGPLVRAHYVSRLIPRARDLLTLCAELPPDALSASRRRRLARRAADAVAAMHDAGIAHADLNLQNILVREPLDDPEVFIVDFDRAEVIEDVPLRRRMANLVRLDRSAGKWPESRRALGPLDRMRFLRAYLGRYPCWRGATTKIVHSYGSRHLRHRFWRPKD